MEGMKEIIKALNEIAGHLAVLAEAEKTFWASQGDVITETTPPAQLCPEVEQALDHIFPAAIQPDASSIVSEGDEEEMEEAAELETEPAT